MDGRCAANLGEGEGLRLVAVAGEPFDVGVPIVSFDAEHDVCGVACGTQTYERVFVALAPDGPRVVFRAVLRRHAYLVSYELAEDFECSTNTAVVDLRVSAHAITSCDEAARCTSHPWDGQRFGSGGVAPEPD